MRAILSWPAAVLLVSFSACPVFAQVIYCSPALHRPLGIAPDACGPGFFLTSPQGVTFGPNYYLRPPWPPENGVRPDFYRLGGAQQMYRGAPHQPIGPGGLPPIQSLPHLPGKQGNPMVTFPNHPFARSPRDFFMWGEAMEDEMSRLRHPALVP